MISIRKILKRVHETSEYIGKSRALAGLRTMDPHWLDKYGYSIDALNRGVDAWPWRKDEPSEAGVETAATVTTLRSGSDAPAPDHAGDPDHEDAA